MLGVLGVINGRPSNVFSNDWEYNLFSLWLGSVLLSKDNSTVPSIQVLCLTTRPSGNHPDTHTSTVFLEVIQTLSGTHPDNHTSTVFVKENSKKYFNQDSGVMKWHFSGYYHWGTVNGKDRPRTEVMVENYSRRHGLPISCYLTYGTSSVTSLILPQKRNSQVDKGWKREFVTVVVYYTLPISKHPKRLQIGACF